MAEVPKGITNEPKNHHEYRRIKIEGMNKTHTHTKKLIRY